MMIKSFSIASEIPDELLIKVGTIVAQWSYEEWMLRQIVYKLLGLDPKRGRIAIREPRPDEYITMFRQLFQITKTKEPEQFKELMSKLKEAKRLRDIVAHGVWGIDPDSGDYAIQYTGGNWQPGPRDSKVSRKVTPEAMTMDLPTLEGISKLIAETIDLTEECVNELIPPDDPAPDES